MTFRGMEGIKCPYEPVEHEMHLLPFTGRVHASIHRQAPQVGCDGCWLALVFFAPYLGLCFLAQDRLYEGMSVFRYSRLL